MYGASGCDQCMGPVGVVTVSSGCDQWVRSMDVTIGCGLGGPDKHHEIPLFAESARISVYILLLTVLLLCFWY